MWRATSSGARCGYGERLAAPKQFGPLLLHRALQRSTSKLHRSAVEALALLSAQSCEPGAPDASQLPASAAAAARQRDTGRGHAVPAARCCWPQAVWLSEPQCLPACPLPATCWLASLPSQASVEEPPGLRPSSPRLTPSAADRRLNTILAGLGTAPFSARPCTTAAGGLPSCRLYPLLSSAASLPSLRAGCS